MAIMGGIRRSPASETVHQQGFTSIFNLEPKLDCPWPAGTSDRAKAAGKRLLATGTVGGHIRLTQLSGEASGAAGLLKNVAIEDIKK